MDALVTIWFQSPPALATAWFGPDARIEQLLVKSPDAGAIPTVIGPRGLKGSDGDPGGPGPPGDVNLPPTLRGGAF